MPNSRSRFLLRGALVGALTSLPVMILSYLGQKLASYTFLPVDLFNKMTGILPGAMVRAGVATLTKVMTISLVRPTDANIKYVEYGISILAFILLGMIFGTALGYFSRLSHQYTRTLGWIGGLSLLVLFLGIETIPSPTMSNLAILFIGTTFLCLGWGWIMGQWAHLETTWGTNAPVTINISRRRFLIYLSATFLAAFISILGIAQYEQKQSGQILNTSAKPAKSH